MASSVAAFRDAAELLKSGDRLARFPVGAFPPGLPEKVTEEVKRGPFPFGTACCAIEFMSTVSSHYDLARFGSEVVRFSPRQSDVLLVAGTINDKMAPVLKRIYDQMADPKWVISMGACACSGGFYRAYHVMQGIDEIIPVDIYVPGCPPTPEGLIYGILQLREKVARDRKKFADRPQRQSEPEKETFESADASANR
jgi:NADH-quinone oxidoreductase subunit B